jgi:hypothetical protein
MAAAAAAPPAAAAAAWPGSALAPLTALTSLELNNCNISGSSDSISWAVSQLAPLIALRELRLLGLDTGIGTYRDAEAPVAGLSQLTQLTSISLGASYISSSAFVGASSLSQLQ